MIELLLAAEGLLTAGRLDQAERLFEQVAEADPRNAIAVVGLARVALARGSRTAALALARRALEIDPQEAAAGRMVAQLEAETAQAAAAVPEAVPEAVPAAAVPEAVPEPEPAAAEPAPTPVAVPETETETEAASAAEIAPPLAPARRSWLDRLVGFFRGR